MGLGLFIAKTLLERTGAVLTFANGSGRASDGDGAVVEVTWQRQFIEAERPGESAPLGDNQPLSPPTL